MAKIGMVGGIFGALLLDTFATFFYIFLLILKMGTFKKADILP